jgi:hypothetical protein
VAGALAASTPAAATATGAWPRDHASQPDGGAPFAHSDLLSAIRDQQVRRAVVDPQRGDATVWVRDGHRHEVAIAPGSDLAKQRSANRARPTAPAWRRSPEHAVVAARHGSGERPRAGSAQDRSPCPGVRPG